MTNQEKQEKIAKYKEKKAASVARLASVGKDYVKKNKLSEEQVYAFIGAFIESQEQGSSLDEYDICAKIGLINLKDQDILDFT